MRNTVRKRTVLFIALFAAGVCLFAQQNGRVEYNLNGWNVYPAGSLKVKRDGKGIIVSGKATESGAGYVVEYDVADKQFVDKNRLALKITGVETSGNTFSRNRLLKLEINNAPMITITPEMQNPHFPDFIMDKNGEAAFDISRINRNIRKINLVFYNCTLENVTIRMYLE